MKKESSSNIIYVTLIVPFIISDGEKEFVADIKIEYEFMYLKRDKKDYFIMV